ncbi:amidohydrolase family protein [Pacificimonas flava]|uniref:Amidohydrolase family protein n=1 Tax=Pacificimonas flava TaxID=1234595 RepID=M2U652_9SPHN|nr:amidohydrolase family protein [Pacificimonas flava]EMD83483.1 amidohydrolase family protein [Pacificimonas flava]MBB5278961.1 imidazolonepropionase-like amidohydrolase [Pacificimonas flava]
MKIAALLLCGAALAGTAHAETSTWRVLSGGDDVGHLIAEEEGGTVTIDYDVKNNGRGPTIAETLTLNADGYPTAWTIKGNTTFGNVVDEWFRVEGGTARWQDATGEGSAPASPLAFYADQNGSPYSAGLMAKALLADEDGSIPVYPSGTATIRKQGTMSFDGPGGPVEATTYEIVGLSMNPISVTLDQDNDLFAMASPRSITVREGYEAADKPLREYVETLSTKRFEDIQARAAHDYEGPVRIRNVRIFDPERQGLTEPRDVVVYKNRIAEIVAAGSEGTPGETVIDGEGGTLVPGMYEMHGHVGQEDALLNIATGVTSIRDMGNENDVLAGLIERIGGGVIAGPRITRSCFIEGESEFSSRTGETVKTEAQGLEQVRWCGARNFNQVKLYNSMKGEWAPALVDEAHRLGMRVAGHVPAFSTADDMIAAGFDEMTHINQIMLGWVLEPDEDTRTLLRLTALDRLPGLDLSSARVRKTLDAMAAKGIAHDPTITIHENLLLGRNGTVSPSFADIIDNMPVSVQRDYRTGWVDVTEPGKDEAYRGAFDKIVETLSTMNDMGIFLVPGTDMGGYFAYHRELELFEKIGLTPAEVLRRATFDMASYLGQEEDLGSIEKNKYADFFLVPGDPTEDLKQLKQIRMVVADGTIYYPSEIYPEFGIEPFASAPPVEGADG